MNGLPRLGHGFAESCVRTLLCGCGSCKGRCCMWAANGAEGRERRARLAENKMGDAGVEALARALPQMAQLTTLDLSSTTSPALCALNSMNGLPRLGHGFAELCVRTLLCGCGSCKGRCCMWAANGAEGRER